MPNTSQNKALNKELDIAPIFAALGDSTRLVIVSKLQHGSAQSISTLTTSFPLTRQGVTRHLRVLENAGIVSCFRRGRETQYRLETGALNRAKSYILRASKQWDDAIDRLERHIEP